MRDESSARGALYGEDHTELGMRSIRAIGDDTAIGISRGRYPKGYPTLDLNEDAVMAVVVGPRRLLAVADGHWGFTAARAALEAVFEAGDALLRAGVGRLEIVRRALGFAVDAVTRSVRDEVDERRTSRTTLTIALSTPTGSAFGGFGDSKAAVFTRRRVVPIWRPAPFLGESGDVDGAWIEESTQPVTRILVASDGLLDFLGRQWPASLRDLAGLAPGEFVAAAIDAAFDGGAGDHISLAVTDVTWDSEST